jgi:hypothetical protein
LKNSKERRKKIFEAYSRNLELIKSNPKVKFNPDFTNGYLCPLCLKLFFEEDLLESSENMLTLEDIPPKSLGGNPKILTCKVCNSISGYKIDIHLLERLKEIDARQFLPNTKIDATLIKDGNRVNTILEIDNNGNFDFYTETNRSNPIEYENFHKTVFSNNSVYKSILAREFIDRPFISEKFKISMPQRSDEHRAEIGLLRVAYLLAYSTLGNSLILNRSLHKVREQLSNPEKNILTKPFWFNYEFPEECVGLNVITEPEDLKCYLVIFNLSTASRKRQFAIALPGPSYPGIKIYDNIDKLLCVNSGGFQNIKFKMFPKLDFINNEDNIWYSLDFWRKYCVDMIDD